MKKTSLIVLLIGLAVLLIAPNYLKRYGVFLLSYWVVHVISTMGLNLIVGYAGQKALGHAGFMAVGAYTVAIMTKAGYSFWLAMPCAAVLCFVLGLIIGFPALRVKMHYLAFATLGFNELISLIARNEEWLTGGTFGLNNVPRPSALGLSLDKPIAYFYLILAFAVLLGFALWWLIRSPWGKAFTALRDNPIRAESLGVDVRAYTLLAFAIGALYGGVAGGLLAPLTELVEPMPFSTGQSIMLYLMVAVGGPGYFFGPLLGSAIGVLLPEWLRFAQGWYLTIFGAAVIAMMIWLPNGLLSIPELLRERRARRAHAASALAHANVR